jgi:hypothetical protein
MIIRRTWKRSHRGRPPRHLPRPMPGITGQEGRRSISQTTTVVTTTWTVHWSDEAQAKGGFPPD